MTAYVRQNKVVNSLPATLDADAIYYVKVRGGFDIYVTDSRRIATSLNSSLSSEDYTSVINEELIGVPKGSPVYTTGTGYKLAQANNPNCKKIIGLVVFDTSHNQLGLVQKSGTMILNNTQWSVISGSIGGIASVNYWLSATNLGKISNISPDDNPTGVWSLKLGCGLNSNSFSIQIQPSVKL